MLVNDALEALKAKFKPKNESEILRQIREKKGASAEFGGYYLLDEARANEVMRPSEILNQIIG